MKIPLLRGMGSLRITFPTELDMETPYSVVRRLKIMVRSAVRLLVRTFNSRSRTKVETFADVTSPTQTKHKENILGRPPIPISQDINKTLAYLKNFLESSDEITIRRFSAEGVELALVYVDGLVDKPSLQAGILAPIMTELKKLAKSQRRQVRSPESLASEILPTYDMETIKSIQDMVFSVLDGKSVLVGSGWNKALAFDVRGWEKRTVQEPETESVLRGPREGFVEDLITNISLIRRRLHHPDLVIDIKRFGRFTRTRVAIMYIQGLARDEVLEELYRRINTVDMDSVLDSGYIEEFIEDNPLSPFPQVASTERPDRAIAAMLQGKVLILTDGTPFALSIPAALAGFLANPEDYYHRWMFGSISRLTRYLAIAISLFLPAMYVAFTTFHQELIPRPLAISIATQRELVPYPAIVEASIMLIVFEILVEASARMPKNMGPTIGIVGALVIGEAAVRASLISNVMVIVIALTALSQFVLVYPMTTAIRILRVGFLIAGATLGLYGIFWALTLLLLHLAKLRSFGMPYLTPFAPTVFSDLKDTLIRGPMWAHTQRPEALSAGNKNRAQSRTGKEWSRSNKVTPPAEELTREAELEAVLDQSTMPKNTGVKPPNAASGSPSRGSGTKPRGVLKSIFRYLRKGRKWIFLLILVLTTQMLTGCWDRREINQLAIVSSVAIDREGEDLLLTVELFRPPTRGHTGEAAGGMPGVRSVVMAEGRGRTFLSAVRDLARKVSRRVYWAQTLACVIGREVAEKSIIEVLSTWDREMELRRTAYLLIAQDKARDVLIKSQGGLESTFAEEIELLARVSKFNGYAFISTVHDVITGISSDSHTAVTAVVSLTTREQPPLPRSPIPGEGQIQPQITEMIELSGLAVFKEDKLSTLVPISPESRGIALAMNKVVSTPLDLECPCREIGSDTAGQKESEGGEKGGTSTPQEEEPGKRTNPEPHMISVKVIKVRAREGIDIKQHDLATLKGTIRVKLDVSLSSQTCSEDLSRTQMMRAIEKEAEDAITQEITKSIQTMQAVLSDPYGFGDALHRKDPKLWQQVKTRWDQVFKSMPVDVQVEVHLVSTGDTRTPPGRCY